MGWFIEGQQMGYTLSWPSQHRPVFHFDHLQICNANTQTGSLNTKDSP
jgi:hypothetical protein